MLPRQLERRSGPLDLLTREQVEQFPAEHVTALADASLDFAERHRLAANVR